MSEKMNPKSGEEKELSSEELNGVTGGNEYMAHFYKVSSEDGDKTSGVINEEYIHS